MTLRPILTASLLCVAAACGSNDVVGDGGIRRSAVTMSVGGLGTVSSRYTSEIWAQERYAYTTTWGRRGGEQVRGNAVYVWNIDANTPTLVDSALIAEDDVVTTGDVQVSDDGALLVVPTEGAPGSIVVFDLADPAHPVRIARFLSPDIDAGVHTCTVARVDGTLYAFLAVNPSAARPSRLVIVDLSDPRQPTQVLVREMGTPFIHDTFVRDGILFAALWSDGLHLFDIGGGGAGGSVANPVALGSVTTVGGQVHNVWWVHDALTGSKRFAIVGEEGPGSVGASSSGDVHVVDIQDMGQPREVAFFHVDGAGSHNFSVDEQQGILYAAYYNAGIKAIDVRGDLSVCPDSARQADDRCSLELAGRVMGQGLLDRGVPVYVWGVHYLDGRVYASDMLNGVWKLTGISR